jgi:hypothetical protein
MMMEKLLKESAQREAEAARKNAEIDRAVMQTHMQWQHYNTNQHRMWMPR